MRKALFETLNNLEAMRSHQAVCLTVGQEQGPAFMHCDASLWQVLTLVSQHHRL